MISNMTLQGLDKLDRKILSSLLTNGRESIANLSRNIGLSRTAVAERINRLEKTGIIKGYTAQIRIESDGRKAASYLLISCE
ncbi:AsnC family transcriptional regulator, partial [Vibrio parahaemolyticus]|nr:AsnC family transcriptional regulator [Vibrio parahaemolyticus]